MNLNGPESSEDRIADRQRDDEMTRGGGPDDARESQKNQADDERKDEHDSMRKPVRQK